GTDRGAGAMITPLGVEAVRRRDPRLVMVAEETMDPGKLQTVTDACAHVRARVCSWKSGVDLEAWPSVLVAGLDAGARPVPDAFLEIDTRRFRGPQVLLVCEERLVRPPVPLQQGRLTLVEPPVTVSRMVGRIRLLLVVEPRDHGPMPLPGPGSFRCREYRHSR